MNKKTPSAEPSLFERAGDLLHSFGDKMVDTKDTIADFVAEEGRGCAESSKEDCEESKESSCKIAGKKSDSKEKNCCTEICEKGGKESKSYKESYDKKESWS